MNLFVPIETGLIMGLIMAFSVFGLAIAFRLFSFPDLTIEGSFLLGAVGIAIAQKNHLGIFFIFFFPMILGASTGCITALLYSKFNINKFLSGILVVAISYTLSLRLMGSSNIGLLGNSNAFELFENVWVLNGFPILKFIFLCGLTIFTGAIVLLLLKSKIGLEIRVAGCNPTYSNILGINVTFSLMIGLAITNALSALSGALLTIHQGFADVGIGQGVLILTLASMTIGERLLSEKKYSITLFIFLSSIFGSVSYQILIAIAIRAGLNPIDLKLVTAILVLILVISKSGKKNDLFSRF